MSHPPGDHHRPRKRFGQHFLHDDGVLARIVAALTPRPDDRLVEFIGYWSMLDVFVVALLTALVRFSVLSRVEPLPGVIFFGLTVVLTMFASMSFDPRLIWDGRSNDD